MLPYYILIAIFMFLAAILTLLNMRCLFITHLPDLEEKSEKSNAGKVLFILLLALILPVFLYLSSYYGSFISPDPYSYILHSNSIISGKKLNEPLINPFYQPYPVFSFIISAISVITSLHPLLSYALFHMVSIFLLALLFLNSTILIRMRADNLTLLIAALLLFGNIYVYGYFSILIPNVLCILAVFIMLFLKIIRSRVALLIFLTGFGFAYFFTIPYYLAICSIISALDFLNSKLTNGGKSYGKVLAFSKSSILIPLVSWLVYLFFTYAVNTLHGIKESFTNYIACVLADPKFEVTGEFFRPFPVINAIGPGLIMGIASGWAINLLYSLIKRKWLKQEDIIMGGILALSIILLSFSFFFLVKPQTKVPAGWSRYGLLVSHYFLGCISILTAQKIFKGYLVSKHHSLLSKLLFGTFLALLLLVPVSGLTDPFTFKPENTTLMLNAYQRAMLNKMSIFLLNYAPSGEIKIMGESSSVLYLKFNMYYLSVNESLRVTTLRTGMKGTTYYQDIDFSYLLSNDKYRDGFILLTGYEEDMQNAIYFNLIYTTDTFKIITLKDN